MSETEQSPGATVATQWLIVWAAIAAGAITTIQITKVSPAMPLIRLDLELGLVAAGWIASVVNLSGAVIGIPSGFVADRFGHRRVMIAGLIFLIIGTFGGSVASSGVLLLVSRFCEGVGYGAIVVAGTPFVVAATNARDRRFALGLWSAYFPIGNITMLLWASHALDALGWRWFWTANAVLCAAFLLLFVALTKSVPTVRRAPSPIRWQPLGSGPWLLALILLVKSFASFSLMTWLPTFAIDQLGRSVTGAALLTAGFVFFFIPANIAGGALVRVRGIRAWHLVAIAGVGIGLLPQGLFLDDLPLAVRFALLVAYACTAGLIPGVIFGAIPVHAPSVAHIGVATGLIVQCASLGNLIGPPILAKIVVSFGGWADVGPLYLFLGALLVLGALALRRAEQHLPRGTS